MFSPKRLDILRSQRSQLNFVVVFMLAATAFSAREALGYSLEGSKWSRNPVMQMSLGRADRRLSDGRRNFNAAAAPAVDMWNQVLRRIQIGKVRRNRLQPARRDGFNSMAFSNRVFGQTWPPTALAVTIVWSSGSTMTEADVLFNRGKSWDSYRGPSRYPTADIQRVALHELGHVIGLDHPDEAEQLVEHAIMNSIINDRYTLSGDDIAGAQYLYAVPSKSILFAQNSFTGERKWLLPGPRGFGDGDPNGTIVWYFDNLGPVSTQSNIVASADFNGSGTADIVWQDSSTQQCSLWSIRWVNYWLAHVGGASLPALPPSWEIATAADFNGDGKPDLLLQNMITGQRMIWFMNGATHTSSYSLGVVLTTTWKITGSGDFNGDGKADILWQNNITGQRMIWFMNGATHIGSWSLGTVPTVWNMVGTIDYNGDGSGDGKPDIVWQNQITGDGVIWLMNGPRPIGSVSTPTLGSDGESIGWSIRNY
jgi:hypothetical protein